VVNWFRYSVAVGFAGALAASSAAPQASERSEPSVVGIVSQTGKLLPLAAFIGGTWKYLPWPNYEDLNESPPPGPVPVELSLIPRQWIAPLSELPKAWHLADLSGSIRETHLGRPRPWVDATFTSVGIQLDMRPRDGNEDLEAGIAASGKGVLLPVRSLDASSMEWHQIVKFHVAAIQAAERVHARRVKGAVVVPSQRMLTAELLSGEIHVAQIEVNSRLSYVYFDTFLIRPTRPADRALNCATTASHAGLLQRRNGGPTQVVWIAGGVQGCGSLEPPGMEILGAIAMRDVVRVVVKWGGDDWVQYALVDPGGPKSRFLAPAMPPR
jgi:hypothetical protein